MKTDNQKINAFVNEQSPEIASIQALNRFYAQNAPSRCVMFGSHFSQRPTIEGSEPGPILTGVEEELGKYTFSVRMPEDGMIIMIVPRYAHSQDAEGLGMSPETLVIYQSHETGKFGTFTVPYFCSHDPVFGFKYAIKDDFHRIAPGANIGKDTIFADSPAVKGESHYTFSANMNLAYMSHPNVGLDGYVIARDKLENFKFRIYEKRVVEFGSSHFLLNLYGDDTNYKAFPDIGEYVHDNGLLAAVRRYDPLMAPALTSRKDVQRIDYHFDEPVFARPGVGRVVDINVVESMNSSKRLPEEMTEQVKRYHIGCMHFYKEILRFYDTEVKKSHRAGKNGYIPLSEELHALIVYAKAVTQQAGFQKQNIMLTYKNKPLDVWRVEFTVEYEVTPSRGFKLSCMNGGGPKLT